VVQNQLWIDVQHVIVPDKGDRAVPGTSVIRGASTQNQRQRNQAKVEQLRLARQEGSDIRRGADEGYQSPKNVRSKDLALRCD
jgi:hypothetical protein